jgi:hypothetical protein
MNPPTIRISGLQTALRRNLNDAATSSDWLPTIALTKPSTAASAK